MQTPTVTEIRRHGSQFVSQRDLVAWSLMRTGRPAAAPKPFVNPNRGVR